MSDVADLEQRIIAALDRVKIGAQAIITAPKEPDTELLEELEIERETNARLVETGQKNIARIERLETRLSRMSDRLESVETENKRLAEANSILQENNATLRNANTEHLGNTDLINTSIEIENKNLHSLRSADLAELDNILGELAPLLKEHDHA